MGILHKAEYISSHILTDVIEEATVGPFVRPQSYFPEKKNLKLNKIIVYANYNDTN